MHRRVSFLLFAAGWGANHFTTLLIVYRVQLHLDASALGLLFGAYALGLIPGLILAGRASDRRGRRKLVLPASIAAIAGSLVLAFGVHGFPVLLAGRLLYGLAMGSIMSPGSVWLQELSPPELGPRRATLALSAGFGLGPLVSGMLAEYAPWPMILPYLAHALTLAVAVALVEPVPETAMIAPTGDGVKGIHRADVVLLVRLSVMAPWVFAFCAVTMAVVPGLLRPTVGHPVIFAAAAIFVTLLAGVVVQPLTTRFGRRADILGLGLGAVGIWLAAESYVTATPWLVFVASLFTGAGYGLIVTTGLREVADQVAHERRGTTVGIYYVLTYVGFYVPFVHAVVARQIGDVLTLRLAAILALVSLVVRSLTRGKRKSAAEARGGKLSATLPNS